jgi:ATP synthase protein I
MERPEKSTPTGKDMDGDGLARLEADLTAFEAKRRKPPLALGVGSASGAGAGYRLLSQMLGGILGGVGLGWLVDHFAHTTPWGVVIGLFAGGGVSVWSTVRMASDAGAPKVTKAGPDGGPRDDA